MKRSENAITATGKEILKSLLDFGSFFFFYLKRKIVVFSRSFERNKNVLVKFFLMKRGRYNRPFLHLTTMGVLGVGVLLAPFLADTYPIFSSNASTLLDIEKAGAAQQSIVVGENVFQTEISEKPRDKVIEYTVQKGDTISTVAQKFNISIETIKWSNNLSSDSLAIGDKLEILPVSGIAHKVTSGDTVYTIAKKYDTEAQKIVDFPFNEFANPETFSLIAGQILIVPDGVKPSEPRPVQRRVYVASGPTTLSPGGFTWPLRGGISQFASWYHMALDITADVGTPIVAGQNGQVTKVSIGTWDGGYGTNVYVENADGFQTHYAHMSSVNVSAGQSVTAGKTVIGWVGMTGRTTGPHLHFEIIKNGVLVNPLGYLQ
jgi:murein DD-endopeptidase MepM/ murein hydrolase activator NlpD